MLTLSTEPQKWVDHRRAVQSEKADDLKREGLIFGSQYRPVQAGTGRYRLEATVAVARGSWLHCIWSQEAERGEWWC